MNPSSLTVLLAAWLLDATFGEPPAPFHPVVWMGNLIRPLKRMHPRTAGVELVTGASYVLAVTGGFSAAAWGVLHALSGWPWAQAAVSVYLLLGCFALRGLVMAGDTVRSALAADDLAGARAGLASLCSRNPHDLEAHELAGAAIESLTENTSDSVVAPLFYFVLFGVPGAVFYRAANTMDAMVGYRGRFEWLGKAAARLDDLLNLVPARLTALLLALAGLVLRLDVAAGVSTWWRDRLRTESPNAGHPMSVAAGLLGVRLDKRGCYVLGEGLARPGAHSLATAQRLTRVSGWLALVTALLALVALKGRHVCPL